MLKSSRVAKTDPSRVGRSSRLPNSEVTSGNKTRLGRLLTGKIKNCSGEFRAISVQTKLAALQQLTAALPSPLTPFLVKKYRISIYKLQLWRWRFSRWCGSNGDTIPFSQWESIRRRKIWSLHVLEKSRFTDLASLAKIYLTANASSVPCESMFSISGMLLNGRRSSLARTHSTGLFSFMPIINHYYAI